MALTEAQRVHAALIATFRGLFSALGGSRFEPRDGYVFLISARVPLPAFNGMWVEGPGEAAAVADLAASIAEVECFGLPSGLLARMGHTPVVAAEARRLGLVHEAQFPVMAATPGEIEPVALPGLKIQVVSDTTALAHALAVSSVGFGLPRTSLAALYSPQVAMVPGVRIYLGVVGGEPVTTALSWAHDRTVGIFQVATRPEHRNQGYAGAVVARAALDGFAAGANLAWLQAGTDSSLYVRLGFRQVERYLLLSKNGARRR